MFDERMKKEPIEDWVSSACPMCNRPVTFGGGITIEYGFLSELTFALKKPCSSQ